MTETRVPILSTAERDRRWRLARAFMEQKGLDALIVYGEHEDSGPAPYSFDNWFTNDRPGVTVVFGKVGEPVVLAPIPIFAYEHVESTARGDDLWIPPENIRIGRHSASLIKVLEEQGLTKSAIGVLGVESAVPVHPEGIMPHSLWSKILSQFPNSEFKSVGEAFAPLVMTLSDEEIEVLQHAGRIGDTMVSAMVKAAGPGVLESEIVRAGIEASLAAGTAVPMMHLNSGPEAICWGPPRWTYRQQIPRTLQKGDVIASEVFANFGMRSTQLQCTIAIGEVHQDFERAAAVARACYEAGLKVLKPDVKFADIAEAMLKPVREAGGWTKGPQVHSLNPIFAIGGFEVDLGRLRVLGDRHPKVASRPHMRGDMVVVPGMSFAFEPSCGFGPHLVTLGSSVILGEDGPIELSPSVAQLLRAG